MRPHERSRTPVLPRLALPRRAAPLLLGAPTHARHLPDEHVEAQSQWSSAGAFMHAQKHSRRGGQVHRMMNGLRLRI